MAASLCPAKHAMGDRTGDQDFRANVRGDRGISSCCLSAITHSDVSKNASFSSAIHLSTVKAKQRFGVCLRRPLVQEVCCQIGPPAKPIEDDQDPHHFSLLHASRNTVSLSTPPPSQSLSSHSHPGATPRYPWLPRPGFKLTVTLIPCCGGLPGGGACELEPHVHGRSLKSGGHAPLVGTPLVRGYMRLFQPAHM